MNKLPCKARAIMRKEGYTLHIPNSCMPAGLDPLARVYIIMQGEIEDLLKLGKVPEFDASTASNWEWEAGKSLAIVAWKVQR